LEERRLDRPVLALNAVLLDVVHQLDVSSQGAPKLFNVEALKTLIRPWPSQYIFILKMATAVFVETLDSVQLSIWRIP
jgi:hypothetical protein